MRKLIFAFLSIATVCILIIWRSDNKEYVRIKKEIDFSSKVDPDVCQLSNICDRGVQCRHVFGNDEEFRKMNPLSPLSSGYLDLDLL